MFITGWMILMLGVSDWRWLVKFNNVMWSNTSINANANIFFFFFFFHFFLLPPPLPPPKVALTFLNTCQIVDLWFFYSLLWEASVLGMHTSWASSLRIIIWSNFWPFLVPLAVGMWPLPPWVLKWWLITRAPFRFFTSEGRIVYAPKCHWVVSMI